MTEREAIEMALDLIESEFTTKGENKYSPDEVIEALRQALAQPEQEPTNLERHERNVQQLFGEPQPEQEPVAFDFQKALRRAYHLGQNYWADADSESYSANKRADKHRQDFDALCAEALANTIPPQRTWVGLTDEEIKYIEEDFSNEFGLEAKHSVDFAFAIEAKLKEKNT